MVRDCIPGIMDQTIRPQAQEPQNQLSQQLPSRGISRFTYIQFFLLKIRHTVIPRVQTTNVQSMASTTNQNSTEIRPRGWQMEKSFITEDQSRKTKDAVHISHFHTPQWEKKFKIDMNGCKTNVTVRGFLDFLSGVIEDSVLLGYDVTAMSNLIPMFRDKVVSSSSRVGRS